MNLKLMIVASILLINYGRRLLKMSNILYLNKLSREMPSLIEMIFDKKKRQETFDYYDSIYEETEEEKEIFEGWSKRRK